MAALADQAARLVGALHLNVLGNIERPHKGGREQAGEIAAAGVEVNRSALRVAPKPQKSRDIVPRLS